MIDTDKYEGHYTDDFARFWVTADDELNADIERANATTNLIDDAPLLLAEVERLRESIKELAERWTDRTVGKPSTLLVLAANELKKVIE